MTLADDAIRAAPKRETLGKLAELLDRSGIDLADVARVNKVKAYQGFYKDADGEAHTVDMHGIELVPSWADGPKWPVVKPGPLFKLQQPKVRKEPTDGWQTCVIFPDIQVGYFRQADDQLEPLHDEAALAVALAMTADVNPDLVVLVGDNADFCEFGKYRTTPAYQRTTQATIDRLTMLCAELRRAAPSARIVWIAGNHEERLPNMLLDNAVAAYGLRRGGEVPPSWPVMSVPYLCHFDRFGVEYLPGYPASTFWINERLRVVHGDRVKSGGSTAHAYLATSKTSVIFGHVHRREWAERTRLDHDGAKTIMAASPGCLARTDGVVPSTKGATDLDGRPIHSQEDWQQGLAVVRFEPGDGRFVYEQIAIHDGWAMYGGKEYRTP